jgi:hypothetical protein
MSRVFKPRLKAQEEKATSKRKRSADDNLAPAKPKPKDEGVTLVADTPVKQRARTNPRSLSQPQLQPVFARSKSICDASGGLSPLSGMEFDDDDEDEWRLPNSPDILLLSGEGGSGSSDVPMLDQEV